MSLKVLTEDVLSSIISEWISCERELAALDIALCEKCTREKYIAALAASRLHIPITIGDNKGLTDWILLRKVSLYAVSLTLNSNDVSKLNCHVKIPSVNALNLPYGILPNAGDGKNPKDGYLHHILNVFPTLEYLQFDGSLRSIEPDDTLIADEDSPALFYTLKELNFLNIPFLPYDFFKILSVFAKLCPSITKIHFVSCPAISQEISQYITQYFPALTTLMIDVRMDISTEFFGMCDKERGLEVASNSSSSVSSSDAGSFREGFDRSGSDEDDDDDDDGFFLASNSSVGGSSSSDEEEEEVDVMMQKVKNVLSLHDYEDDQGSSDDSHHSHSDKSHDEDEDEEVHDDLLTGSEDESHEYDSSPTQRTPKSHPGDDSPLYHFRFKEHHSPRSPSKKSSKASPVKSSHAPILLPTTAENEEEEEEEDDDDDDDSESENEVGEVTEIHPAAKPVLHIDEAEEMSISSSESSESDPEEHVLVPNDSSDEEKEVDYTKDSSEVVALGMKKKSHPSPKKPKKAINDEEEEDDDESESDLESFPDAIESDSNSDESSEGHPDLDDDEPEQASSSDDDDEEEHEDELNHSSSSEEEDEGRLLDSESEAEAVLLNRFDAQIASLQQIFQQKQILSLPSHGVPIGKSLHKLELQLSHTSKNLSFTALYPMLSNLFALKQVTFANGPLLSSQEESQFASLISSNWRDVEMVSMKLCGWGTDAVIQSIALHCPSLHTLILRYFQTSSVRTRFLTDQSLQTLAVHATQLRNIQLEDAHHITSAGILSLCRTIETRKLTGENSKGLQVLHVENCKGLTPEGIIQAIEVSTSVEELSIVASDTHRDITFVSIMNALVSTPHPHVKTLKLWCFAPSDPIPLLSEDGQTMSLLRSLQAFDVVLKSRTADEETIRFFLHSLPEIREFSLFFPHSCAKIALDGIEFTRAHVPHIHSLLIFGPSITLSTTGMQKWLAEHPYLQAFRVLSNHLKPAESAELKKQFRYRQLIL